MERHQAGQEETLVEVSVETDSLEVAHRPRGSPVGRCGSSKCVVTLAAVMGLVTVALVAGFVLHFFIFLPSCNQDTTPLSDTAKVSITCQLKESAEQGRYDIFTVNKSATYLIYGWVKFSDNTSKVVTLEQTYKENTITLQTKEEKENKTEMLIFDKAMLANTSKLSIHFKSTYTDSLFHICEL